MSAKRKRRAARAPAPRAIQSLHVGKTLAYLRQQGGATAAETAEHFGLTVPFTGYALRALRTAKRVRSRGNTRGTRYYAA